MQKGFWQSTHLHEFDQRFIDFISSESRIPIGRGFSEGQVIHWHGIVDKEDDEAILAKNGIGHRIDMVILEDIQLNGVMFDHFLKGGIELKNPDMRSSWKNVFYGEHNEGTPDELFKKHEHAGKMGYRL